MGKQIAFFAGGMGAAVGRLTYLLDYAMALYQKDGEQAQASRIKIIVSHKDELNGDAQLMRTAREQHKKLLSADDTHYFIPTDVNLNVFDATATLRHPPEGQNSLGEEGQPLTLYSCCQENENDKELLNLFYSAEAQALDLNGGYYQTGSLGAPITSTYCDILYEKYFKEDCIQVFNGQDIRIAICCGLNGAEGRATAVSLVYTIINKITEYGRTQMGRTDEQVKEDVKNRLQIGMVFLGTGVRLPNQTIKDSVNNDFRNISPAELVEITEELQDYVDSIFYIDAPEEFVQSPKRKTHGNQEIRQSTFFITAAKAVNTWLENSSNITYRNDDGTLRIIVDLFSHSNPSSISHVSWNTLRLSQQTVNAIISRINFSTLVLMHVRCEIDEDEQEIRRSPFLVNVFGPKEINNKTAEELRKIKQELDAVCEQEMEFLKAMFQIGCTGTDWSKNMIDYGDKTSLFNTRQMQEVLNYYQNTNDIDPTSFSMKDLTTYRDEEDNSQSQVGKSSLRDMYDNAKLVTRARWFGRGRRHCGNIYAGLAHLYQAGRIENSREVK